jgi:DNA repair protein RecO (recombination protein O)
MNQITTKGIVLSRTEFGEADRIIKFLTPDRGKISGLAKGVRKSKSKLAGGIELFSVTDLSFIIGRGEIYTVTSACLVHHYDNIVKEIDRTNAAYELIRLINKSTAEHPEEAYFDLLRLGFEGLDNLTLDSAITALWFNMQLIKLAGHSPNLQTDCEGSKLSEKSFYNFDFESMCFDLGKKEQGIFNSNHIKFLRLGFASNKPQILHKITDARKISGSVQPLIQTMLQNFVRA